MTTAAIEMLIVDTALVVAIFTNLLLVPIAIVTKNIEAQLFLALMPFGFVVLALIYNKPILAFLGCLAVAILFIYCFFFFKGQEQSTKPNQV